MEYTQKVSPDAQDIVFVWWNWAYEMMLCKHL